MTMSAKTTKHGVSIRLSGVHAANFVKAAMPDQTNKKAVSGPEMSEMKSFEQLAQHAYQAYTDEEAQHHGGRAPISWEALPRAEQACWVKSAKAVAAEIAAIH